MKNYLLGIDVYFIASCLLDLFWLSALIEVLIHYRIPILSAVKYLRQKQPCRLKPHSLWCISRKFLNCVNVSVNGFHQWPVKLATSHSCFMDKAPIRFTMRVRQVTICCWHNLARVWPCVRFTKRPRQTRRC